MKQREAQLRADVVSKEAFDKKDKESSTEVLIESYAKCPGCENNASFYASPKEETKAYHAF